MLMQTRSRMGLIGVAAVVGLFGFSSAIAQRNPSNQFFQGRGIAQGAAFARGRNAHVTLTLEGNNFSLELTDPPATNTTNTQNQPPTRIQYRGVVSRRDNDSNNPSNFTLNTRVRSFDSTESLRVITNTAGTCRLEVFGARVVYSHCKTAANDSSVRFLGLEQF